MTIKLRWTCPTGEHQGALAPSRMRRDDMRRYCVTCSLASGKLTERVAPKLEGKRQVARHRATVKAAKRRAKKRANVTQVDLVTRFACGKDALALRAYKAPHLMTALWRVAPSKRARNPKVTDHVITLYDAGLDEYEARAQVLLAELLWLRRNSEGSATAAKTYIRSALERSTSIRPRLNAPVDKSWIEIADMLRAEVAVTKMGHGVTLTRMAS